MILLTMLFRMIRTMNRKTESYKTGRAYIRNDICFFGGKNETGMGIYIVLDGNRNADHVFVGGGLLGFC